MNITYHNTYGCDCIMYPVEAYIDRVDFIFTGKVIELLDKKDSNDFILMLYNQEFYKNKSYTVKILILNRLKVGNIEADTLEFTSDFTNCDPLYILGESYLFFANKSENNKFKMAHCTYWGFVNKSRKHIKKLWRKLK